MKLDLKTVARLKEPPAGKADAIIFDDALPSFGLRLRTGGHRTWIVQYRVAGRSKRVTIGTVERLTIEQARAAARKILASVTLGGDPAADRHRERETARLNSKASSERARITKRCVI